MSEVWAANRLLFSRKEVSLLLNLSARQITRLLDNEKLRVTRVGRRTMVHRDEVARFAANGLPYTHPA